MTGDADAWREAQASLLCFQPAAFDYTAVFAREPMRVVQP